MVSRNEYAIQVLKRMFKKFLFTKIDSQVNSNQPNHEQFWT